MEGEGNPFLFERLPQRLLRGLSATEAREITQAHL